jgi:hypothetical protein
MRRALRLFRPVADMGIEERFHHASAALPRSGANSLLIAVKFAVMPPAGTPEQTVG